MTVQSPTSTAAAVSASQRPDGIPTQVERDLLELALIAKGVCSGIHITGRTVDQVLKAGVRPSLSDGTSVVVSQPAEGLVRAEGKGLIRHAVYCGDQGAVVLPIGAHAPFFESRRTRERRPRSSAPWPIGDARPDPEAASAFEAAGDAAFRSDPDTGTAAFVVIHKGALVYERYAAGVGPDTPLEAWSMGKSLTAALLATLVERGLCTLQDRLDLPEWSAPGDPRRAITFEDALRMSSGLAFSAPWAEDFDPAKDGAPDHGYIYSGAVDTRSLVVSKALRHRPGAFGAYKNGDTLLIMAALEDRLGAGGHDRLSWPYQTLLSHLGADTILIETDVYGNFLPTGFIYGSARDWARLALLFLDGGVWDGQRIASAEVLAACFAPSPGWRGKYWMAVPPKGYSDSIYGGHVWLNRHAPQDRWPLPDDAAFFLGVGGQYVFLCPSLDLIVVRMGDIRPSLDNAVGRGHLPDALKAVVSVIEGADA